MMMIIIGVCNLNAQRSRDLLKPYYKDPGLDTCMISAEKWIKFPKYQNREAWNTFNNELRINSIKEGEKYINFSWPAIPATSYLDYVRSGVLETMRLAFAERKKALDALVMAELFEGKGRFMDDIINGVWAYCELTYWGLSSHLSLQKKGSGLPDHDEHIIDLGVGEVSNSIAWIHYFFKEEFYKINPIINERVKYELNRRILEPYLTRDDFWWMGFNLQFVNNWNPWCNYNALTCFLLTEDDKQRQMLGVRKVMRSVDNFLNYYKDDGACEEGPAYWEHAGGKLFELLDMLKDSSGGCIDLSDNELIANIGQYIINAHISYPYFINFADSQPKVHHSPTTIYRFGKYVGNKNLMKFGSFIASNSESHDNSNHSYYLNSALHNVFYYNEILQNENDLPLVHSFWLPDTGIAGARDNQNNTKGFYFAAKGGFNGESHNHNDVGSFILYYNGNPCLIDVGVETYTKKTFSPERYEIWTMQSQYHNLPVINGLGQSDGNKFVGRNSKYFEDGNNARFSVDIASAYPTEANIKSWVRSYELTRGKEFKITDRYDLQKTLNNTSLNFMTSCDVDSSTPGKIKLIGDNFSLDMVYDTEKLLVQKEIIGLKDEKLKKSWGKDLTRILFKFKNIDKKGENIIVIKNPAI